MHYNPLLQQIAVVQEQIDILRQHARSYYFDVVMAEHTCPACAGRLAIIGPSKARCVSCGDTLDPTLTYQRSACCDSTLAFRRRHYACSSCENVVPSPFLFDEKLFDSGYFQIAMAESRERKRCAREELRLLLASSRSSDLPLTETPDIGAVPGLLDALADLLGNTKVCPDDRTLVRSDFRLEEYRAIVLRMIHEALVHFDAIPFVNDDSRIDRARRFTTLVFMEQAREIRLEQTQTGILVVPCA